MADLSITATGVVKGVGAKTKTTIAGAAVTAGQALYIDAADENKGKLADTDHATAAVRVLAGIALNNAASGQPVTYQYKGRLTIGATVAVGKIYVLSDTAGGIKPVDDLAAGDYTSVLGIAISTTEIDINIQNGGVAHA